MVADSAEKRLREIVLDTKELNLINDAFDLTYIRFRQHIENISDEVTAWGALSIIMEYYLGNHLRYPGEISGTRYMEYRRILSGDHRITAVRKLIKTLPDIRHYLYKTRCGKWLLIAPRLLCKHAWRI